MCHQCGTEAVIQETAVITKENDKQKINRKMCCRADLKYRFSCMAACLGFSWMWKRNYQHGVRKNSCKLEANGNKKKNLLRGSQSSF